MYGEGRAKEANTVAFDSEYHAKEEKSELQWKRRGKMSQTEGTQSKEIHE